MTAGEMGQVATVLAAVFGYPVYRYLRGKWVTWKARRSIKRFLAERYSQAWDEAIRVDLAGGYHPFTPRLVSDAPIGSPREIEHQYEGDAGYPDRARKAESLGFLDSFEDEPRPAA